MIVDPDSQKVFPNLEVDVEMQPMKSEEQVEN